MTEVLGKGQLSAPRRHATQHSSPRQPWGAAPRTPCLPGSRNGKFYFHGQRVSVPKPTVGPGVCACVGTAGCWRAHVGWGAEAQTLSCRIKAGFARGRDLPVATASKPRTPCPPAPFLPRGAALSAPLFPSGRRSPLASGRPQMTRRSDPPFVPTREGSRMHRGCKPAGSDPRSGGTGRCAAPVSTVPTPPVHRPREGNVTHRAGLPPSHGLPGWRWEAGRARYTAWGRVCARRPAPLGALTPFCPHSAGAAKATAGANDVLSVTQRTGCIAHPPPHSLRSPHPARDGQEDPALPLSPRNRRPAGQGPGHRPREGGGAGWGLISFQTGARVFASLPPRRPRPGCARTSVFIGQEGRAASGATQGSAGAATEDRHRGDTAVCAKTLAANT